MPRRDHWDTFFDPPRILNRLGFDRVEGAVVDVGAGYGTFTLATVRCTDREVAAIGIEQTPLDDLVAKMRDGTGLPDGSAGIVLLFNLLHCEQPFGLLAEAQRTLRPAGRGRHRALAQRHPDATRTRLEHAPDARTACRLAA